MSGVLGIVMGAAAFNGASYVGGSRQGGDSPTPASLGAVVGDFATVLQPGGSSTVSSGGSFSWASLAGGVLSYRTLNAADLTAPVHVPAGTIYVLTIYRGVAAISYKGQTSATQAGPNTAPGFARAIKHVGLLAMTANQIGGNVVDLVTAPATWTQRLTGSTNTIVGTQFDRLGSVNPPYVDNTPISWTANNSSGQDYILLFELTSS
jgi:hypothetical protein